MFQSSLAKYAVLVFTLLFQAFHFTYSKPTGFSMQMIMRDSPESPSYPGNLTQLQRIERLIRFSKDRARYLKASSNISVVDPKGEGVMALHRTGFLYYVFFLMGTPMKRMYLAMDTGSSTTWTQCLPCSECYPQSVAIYDSSASSTFAELPCSSPLCSDPGTPFKCVENECKFSVSYHSGQASEGEVATETLRFLRRDGRINTVDRIVFGCARRTTGFRSFENTAMGGIMGLNSGKEGIVTQLGEYANNRFSYCLFPLDRTENKKSTLTFGDAIPAPPGNAFVTPILPHPDPFNSYYFLDLRDISVGSRRLHFPPGTFQASGDSGGLIIDSGSGFTHLAEIWANPYLHVTSAFEEYYANKGLVKITVSGMELCYSYPDGFVDFASMTYHFSGADLYVDGKLVSVFGDENGKVFCVAILPGGRNSILGAVHQQNTRFIFDGHANTLQFYSDVCN